MSFFANLAGAWRFDRTVSPGPAMHGTATFTRQSASELLYVEEGSYKDEGREFYKSYLYRMQENGLHILYRDGPDAGKPFLHFPVAETAYPFALCASHLCQKDLYNAEFTFTTPGTFKIFYRIRGPQKDYTIETHYQKS